MEHTDAEQEALSHTENEKGETTTASRPDASPRPSPRSSRDSQWEVLSVTCEEVPQLTVRQVQTRVLNGTMYFAPPGGVQGCTQLSY